MAENKKSVLLYCDIIHTIECLSDEEAGNLFKHYLRYINDLNPCAETRLTALLFEPIKQNLKRDLKKWESIIDKRKVAGSIGGKQKVANAKSATDIVANVAVIDNVNVKVKEINNNIDIRKLKFADTLKPFLDKYGKEMIRKFYDYWTEPNKSNTKFKQELQKTWDVKRRLDSWSSNNFDNKKQQHTYNHDTNGLI
jgi:Family of unknown function (DUF6291)